MILEAPLALAKRCRVIMTPPVPNHCGHVVMQHLVKDDRLDEEPWNPGLIQNRMDPDETLFGEIRAELEGLLASLGPNALAPSDVDVESPSEMTSP